MRAQVLPTVARTTKGTLRCPLYSWGEPTLLTSMGRARATACCMHCATALATLLNTAIMCQSNRFMTIMENTRATYRDIV